MTLSVVDRNESLSEESRRLLERRLAYALSRFDSRIQQITAVIEDVNGPRGGHDKMCRISVKLAGARDLLIREQDADIDKCITRAADRLGRAAARAVEQSRRFPRFRNGEATSDTSQ